jgi:hypothetical protein
MTNPGKPIRMKIRLATYLCGIGMILALGGCATSCYQSNDTVLTQISIGDPAEPAAAIPRFPAVPIYVTTVCQTSSPVRVELYIDRSGYAQGVSFLDPWPNECAKKYEQQIKQSRLIDTPLARPLEHFRVDLQTSQVSSRQCIRLSN